MKTNFFHLHLQLWHYNEGQQENTIYYKKIHYTYSFLTHQMQKSKYTMLLKVETFIIYGGNNDKLAAKAAAFCCFLADVNLWITSKTEVAALKKYKIKLRKWLGKKLWQSAGIMKGLEKLNSETEH